MQKHCITCGSPRFRLSHFRIQDIWQLFILRYPVRCLDCRQRSHASLFRLSRFSSRSGKAAKAG